MTIIYTSETGFTKKYAELLAKRTGCEVYSAEEAKGRVERNSKVIYMGWLFANSVKGYKKAAKRYDIKAVCAVGLTPTGYMIDEVRKSNNIPDNIALFTLQGGMDHARLKGINKFAISILIKMLTRKKNDSDEDKAKLELIKNGGDFVSENNLCGLLEWYKK